METELSESPKTECVIMAIDQVFKRVAQAEALLKLPLFSQSSGNTVETLVNIGGRENGDLSYCQSSALYRVSVF